MIDRNTIFAFAILLALFSGYQVYYDWRFGDFIEEQETIKAEAERIAALEVETDVDKTERATQPVADTADDSAGPGAEVVETPLPVPTETKVMPGDSPVEAAVDSPVETPVNESLFTVDTGAAEIVITNKGASLKHFRIKKYQDTDGNYVDLIFNYNDFVRKKQEDEDNLVLARPTIFPTLGFTFPSQGFAEKVNNALFSVVSSRGDPEIKDKPFTITYAHKDGSGIEFIKEYTFKPNQYAFDFSVTVKSTPKWKEFDYGLIWFGLGDEKSDLPAVYSYQGPTLMANDRRVSEAPDEDDPAEKYNGDIKWAALSNRYYTTFGIPKISDNQTVVARYVKPDNYALEWKMKATLTETPNDFTMFVGPKSHEALEGFPKGIPSIIDYGWWDFLSKPIFWLLNKFHSMLGNWGWAIILLTFVTKLVFFPLSQKSFRSMKKLQKLQPKIKQMQEAYKGDKEKLNSAMMAMYKEQKVNPLGGCLPMLVQIPIFFALYKVLLESIELKGVPWILWITDLSIKDPYYVTPVLMGASMFIQQKMTPNTGDPTQRKIMMALPLVFTFLFLSFPAGLVLYWLVNNVLTIAQQWIIYRESDEPKKKKA